MESNKAGITIPPCRPRSCNKVCIQWLVLGFILLIIAVIGVSSLLYQRILVGNNERGRLQAQARIVEKNLSRELEAANSALQGLLNDLPNLQGPGGLQTASRRMKALSDAMPGIRTMFMTDVSGKIIASSRDELLGRDLSYRDYFMVPRQNPDQSRLYVSPPFKSVLGVSLINLTRMIPGPNGEFKGVVSAAIDPEFFSILMSSVLYAPDMWSGIAHSDGKLILMVPERTGASGKDLSGSSTLFSRHRASGRRENLLTGVSFLTGFESMMALHTISPADLHMDKPLVVSVTRNIKALYSSWLHDAVIEGALFSLFTVASMMGLLFYQRRQEAFDRHAEETKQSLAVSARRYESLLKSATDGIHILNMNGKLVEANHAFLNMLGYNDDDVNSLHVWDWDAQFDAETLIARIKVLTTNPDTFETRHKKRDGQIIDVEISARGVLLGDENYLYASSRDITMRKQAENELRDSRQQMMDIIDFLPDATFVINFDGKVIAWNKAMEEMSGVKKEDMIGQGDYAYTVPFYGERRPQLLDLLETSDEELEAKYQHIQRLGDLLYAEAYVPTVYAGKGAHVWAVGAPLYNTDGKKIGAIESIRNINERKLVEVELQQAKEIAEASTRSKSAFLANMSHEIRTPMNAILGLTRLTLETSLSEKQRDYLFKVQSSSRALLNILNDILDYSKIEAGRLDLENIDFDLDGVLHSLSDIFSYSAEEKGLEIFYEVMPDVPMMLKGDPLRLGQILSNLIGNAIKFTNKGEVHVKAECFEQSGNDIVLRFLVRDTGIGIEPDKCGTLFQAFSQVDSSISRKYGGTGLGLTINKHLVGLMGGEIMVESKPGKGSIFSFTVRLQRSQIDISPRDPNNLRGMRALVVDDQETSRIILQQIMESWSFEVVTASSGDTAVGLILQAAQTQRPFELILLDWKMPGLDGLEVAGRVQGEIARGVIQHAPIVIMVSAYGKEHLLECADGTHLDDILLKPVTSSNLFDSVISIQNQKTRNIPHHTKDLQEPINEKLAGIHGAHILLVEDNAINQQVALESLEKMGFLVEIANNGREAVDMAAKNSYDAILMDLQMPEMDGFEATRLIRATTSGKNVPIIALTAAAMVQEKEACLDGGMNDHVAKPIEPAELAAALIAWIEPGDRTPALEAVPAEPSSHGAMELPQSLAGFDLDSAVRRLHGNRALLAKLLHTFADGTETVQDELHIALEAGDFPKAARQVHSVKGLAGNLGIVELFVAANKLEQELLAGTAVSGCEFESLLQSVAETIYRSILITPADMKATIEVNRTEAAAILLRLQGLVESCSLVPNDLQQELKAMLYGHVPESMIDTLLRQLNSFEHGNAKNTVLNIASKLVISLGN